MKTELTKEQILVMMKNEIAIATEKIKKKYARKYGITADLRLMHEINPESKVEYPEKHLF